MRQMALPGVLAAVVCFAAATPASPRGEASPKPPGAGVCVPKTIRIEYFSSLGGKLGEYDAKFQELVKVYPNDPYSYKCLWYAAAPKDEAFVVFISNIPIGTPGRIASGNCDGTRKDSYPFYNSRKRYLGVSGGNRKEFQNAVGGNERILKSVLAAAEAAGVGVPCPGSKPKPPPPPPSPAPTPPPPPLKRSGNLYIDYSMQPRFGIQGKDGMIEYHDTSIEIQPVGFRVEFVVRRLDGKPCKGTLSVTAPRARSSGSAKGCSFHAIYGNEGTYTVRVKLDNTGFLEEDELEGLLQFPVQDWLIVGLGDSNGSGEGAPDVPRKNYFSAGWQNEQCHRSANSFEAKAAREIEQQDGRTSVTFVHLACSGASILNGMLGPYAGIEPKKGKPLDPQTDVMGRVVGGREIDAVLISIGVNDLKFGRLVAHCIKKADCPNKDFADAEPVRPLKYEIASLLGRLPLRYRNMAAALKRAGVQPNRVFLSEYFDSTKDQNGKTCSPLIATPIGFFDGNEARWAYDDVLVPLNRRVKQAVRANGWKFIGGAARAFRTHGYCARPTAKRWIVGLFESLRDQKNAEGTLHSTSVGNGAQAAFAVSALRGALYPGGRTRAPR